MRICPTCGDMVAATLRCCPRCSGPLPEPRTGYGGPPGYAREPGYPAEAGVTSRLRMPRRLATSRLRMPRRLTTSRNRHIPRSPGMPWNPGTGRNRTGRRGTSQRPTRMPPGRKCSGTGSLAQAPRPAGFPPGQPRNRRPSRRRTRRPGLLCAPPGRRHQALRRRARIAGAVLGTVALLAGVITAWAVFGQDRAEPRLAGRQTTATHRASPGARATPSPAPPVPAPGDGAIVVAMAPGMSQAPDAAQVDGFLVSYFTAINTHDYERYERLLVPSRRAELTAADFARGTGRPPTPAPASSGSHRPPAAWRPP